MSNKVLKPKKASLYQFTQKYSNTIDNCIEFFNAVINIVGIFLSELIKRSFLRL